MTKILPDSCEWDLSKLTDSWEMANILTDNWKMTKILTKYWESATPSEPSQTARLMNDTQGSTSRLD